MSLLDPLMIVTLQDNGVDLKRRHKHNFIGFVITDDAEHDVTNIEGGGGVVEELTPIDLALHEITIPGAYGPAAFRPSTAVLTDEQFRPAALVTVDDAFTDATFTRFTEFTTSTLGTKSISGGLFSVAMASGAIHSNFYQEGGDITFPQIAVSIKIDSITHSGSDTNTAEHAGVGIAKDSSNFIHACWRRKQGTHGAFVIQVKIAGTANDRLTVALGADLTPPFEIGFSMLSSEVAMWHKPNGGVWTLVGSYNANSDKNFKTTSLTGWTAVFSAYCDGVAQATFNYDNFRRGRFGCNGFRDAVAVTNPAGDPIITDDTVTLTATCTHGDSVVGSYGAVFTYNLVTRVLTQVGVLYSDRDSGYYNDSASHIIKRDDGTFDYFVTSWGNTGAANIQVLYKHETSLNLLAGANFVGSLAVLALPGLGSGGAYDPHVVKVGSTYYIAYTVGPVAANSYYPALASSTDLSSFTAIGSDVSAAPSEGTRIVHLDDAYWVLSSHATNQVRVYDLSMEQQGIMTNPFNVATNGAPPHPMLIPYGRFVHLITFDSSLWNSNAGTNGLPRAFRGLRYGVSL